MIHNILISFFLVLTLFVGRAAGSPKKSLPRGFVFLKDIDPTILQSARYFGSENFIGRKVLGYETMEIVVSLPTAQALQKVQAELRKQGYGLVIYDGYRPQRAVTSFVEWSKHLSDQTSKSFYYPTIHKADLFKMGYIAEKSGHSRGSTVDLTMILKDQPVHNVTFSLKTLPNGVTIPFLDDGTVDMGSSYDLFHDASHHDSSLVSPEATRLRNMLRKIMKQHGFKEYQAEWWHYTLEKEPYPNEYFDFIPLVHRKGNISDVRPCR